MQVTYNSANDTITISGDLGSNTSVTLNIMSNIGQRVPGYPKFLTFPGGGNQTYTTAPLNGMPPYTVVVMSGSSVESATVP